MKSLLSGSQLLYGALSGLASLFYGPTLFQSMLTSGGYEVVADGTPALRHRNVGRPRLTWPKCPSPPLQLS